MMRLRSRPKLRAGEMVTVHQCSDCGRIEGERAQAGCCPGCGRASLPNPVLVQVIGERK